MLELSHGEKLSPLWVKLNEFLQERKESARRRIEQPLSTDETNIVRGRITEINAMLSLNDDVPHIPPFNEGA